MTRKLFGTDGIRGCANQEPMTADMALHVAMAVALTLRSDNSDLHQNRVVIGKDTRLSCYMLEQAMASGFTSMGMDVMFLGPLPTPAVAMLTRSLRADVGVMISASHNPYQDNGIKLFGRDGYKLSDEVESAIEERIFNRTSMMEKLPTPENLGKANRLDDAVGRYVEFVKSSIRRRHTLDGLKIVIDAANGAAYKVAPQLFWELEAEVISIGVQPNGRNINDNCGATSPGALQKAVIENGADIGIALDGDADRVIFVDEKGNVIDGDQIMALLAKIMNDQDRLSGGGIVSTVMSNLGLERFVNSMDMDLFRTPVGDRYVVEAMRAKGCNLGGEQSGHIILSDFSTAGDGLLTALQVLKYLHYQDKPASEVMQVFTPLPQILQNVRFEAGKPLDDEKVQAAIKKAEAHLANDGRIIVRASGTEPVIRVMAEGDDANGIRTIVEDLCSVIESVVKTA